MKIGNILESPFQTDVVDRQSNRDLQYWRQYPNQEKRGTFSVVRPDRDPHLVKKSSIMSRDEKSGDEGFKAFAKYIIENGYMDNPHMPRIYQVKTIKGNDGFHIDSYKMEALIDGEDIDDSELADYFDHILLDKYKWDEYENPYEYIKDYPNEKGAVHTMICIAIEDATRRGAAIFTLDSLNEACVIVHEAKYKIKHANLDIHTGNIMYRRTANGLQLVFSDPIFAQRRN